ncbi:MAG: YybH family protein [Thermoanaerobaculia bacterium]
MKLAFRVLPFVLTFFAVFVSGRADGVLWFEAVHEGGGAQGVPGAVDAFFRADNQNEIDRLAACLDEEAVWMPPTGEVVKGRRAISAWYRARHLRWTPALSAAILDLHVDRSSAVVHGAARGSMAPACGGPSIAVDDRFVMFLSRDVWDGWRVTRLYWKRGEREDT